MRINRNFFTVVLGLILLSAHQLNANHHRPLSNSKRLKNPPTEVISDLEPALVEQSSSKVSPIAQTIKTVSECFDPSDKCVVNKYYIEASYIEETREVVGLWMRMNSEWVDLDIDQNERSSYSLILYPSSAVVWLSGKAIFKPRDCSPNWQKSICDKRYVISLKFPGGSTSINWLAFADNLGVLLTKGEEALKSYKNQYISLAVSDLYTFNYCLNSETYCNSNSRKDFITLTWKNWTTTVLISSLQGNQATFTIDPNTVYYMLFDSGNSAMLPGTIFIPQNTTKGLWKNNLLGVKSNFVATKKTSWISFGRYIISLGNKNEIKYDEPFGFTDANTPTGQYFRTLCSSPNNTCTPEERLVAYFKFPNQDALVENLAKFIINIGASTIELIPQNQNLDFSVKTTIAFKKGWSFVAQGCSDKTFQENLCEKKLSFLLINQTASMTYLKSYLVALGQKNKDRFKDGIIVFNDPSGLAIRPFCYPETSCSAENLINVYFDLNDNKIVKVLVKDEAANWVELRPINNNQKLDLQDINATAIKKAFLLRPSRCSESGDWQNNICKANIEFLVIAETVSWAQMGETISNRGANVKVNEKLIYVQPTGTLGKISYCYNPDGCKAETNDYIAISYDPSNLQITNVTITSIAGNWVVCILNTGLEKFNMLTSKGLKAGAWLKSQNCSKDWDNQICAEGKSFAVSPFIASADWSTMGQTIASVGDNKDLANKDIIKVQIGTILKIDKKWCYDPDGCLNEETKNDFISVMLTNNVANYVFIEGSNFNFIQLGVEDTSNSFLYQVDGIPAGTKFYAKYCSNKEWSNICNEMLVFENKCPSGSWIKLSQAIKALGDKKIRDKYSECLSIYTPKTNSSSILLDDSQKIYINMDYYLVSNIFKKISISDNKNNFVNFKVFNPIQFKGKILAKMGDIMVADECSNGIWKEKLCNDKRIFYIPDIANTWEVVGQAVLKRLREGMESYLGVNNRPS